MEGRINSLEVTVSNLIGKLDRIEKKLDRTLDVLGDRELSIFLDGKKVSGQIKAEIQRLSRFDCRQ